MTEQSDTAGVVGRPTRVRRTRQADTVVGALEQADGFRTAQEIYAALQRRGERVGLTTVYRHLNALAEQHVVDVVIRDDGETQYRLCGPASDPDGDGHHHHVVCRVCGRSVTASGPEVEAWAERVAAAAGYTDITHTVEVFGRCPDHSRPARRGRG